MDLLQLVSEKIFKLLVRRSTNVDGLVAATVSEKSFKLRFIAAIVSLTILPHLRQHLLLGSILCSCSCSCSGSNIYCFVFEKAIFLSSLLFIRTVINIIIGFLLGFFYKFAFNFFVYYNSKKKKQKQKQTNSRF